MHSRIVFVWVFFFSLLFSRASLSAWGCAGLSVEPAGTELCFQKALHHHTLAVCLNTHSLCISLTETRGKIPRCWNGIFTASEPHAELRWLSQMVVCLALVSGSSRNAGERQRNTDVSFNLIRFEHSLWNSPSLIPTPVQMEERGRVSSSRCFALFFPPDLEPMLLTRGAGWTFDSF